ncbi:calcium/proton exchanger [Nitrososphaera sp. AFS]|uniref:calcium/proton exchanger n=1 Tax=Nitrososphaera sp. AFS TaxID=2301191 RepID=UPI0021055216|nr:calcium/proton exchanger [Nitrososphaera sp. AFS]NAL77891.1 calcium/proton exchanger [Nitrososphaera sp. AFS]
MYFLIIFAPMALVLQFSHSEIILTFLFAAIALIPLARLIGDSTENLATHYGTTTASLLNVTFGNAAEIIIGIVALSAGLSNLVKASIIGSVIGNILLIFGLSLFVGGLKQKEQSFNREHTGYQSSMLFLAIIGLAIPTILAITVLGPGSGANLEDGQRNIQFISDILAVVLLGVYIASIIFTFVTHKHLFTVPLMEGEQDKLQKITKDNNNNYRDIKYREPYSKRDGSQWSKKKSLLVLGASVVGVILTSEVLVSSIEEAIKIFGFGEMFVGAIIIGIVGNVAEHSSAIMLARRGKLDLSIGIAAGSGTQVAIFVVPALVIAGLFLNRPFNLVFTIYELAVVFLAAIILNLIAHDGKSNWFEGVMLIAVYIMISVGFFFIR